MQLLRVGFLQGQFCLADDARQQLLELPMPEGHTGVVVPMAKKGRAA